MSSFIFPDFQVTAVLRLYNDTPYGLLYSVEKHHLEALRYLHQ